MLMDYENVLMGNDNECDFQLVVEKIKTLLMREGVTPTDFELKSSPDYDGITVTCTRQFTALMMPVQYMIQYYCSFIYGMNCCFAASIGVPRSEGGPTELDCKKIASEFRSSTGIMVSFEGYDTGKRIGAFHVICSIDDKHITDVDEMQQYLYQVRCTVADIASSVFMKCAELFVSGKAGDFGTIAKLEQINSIHEDDRVIISRDIFEDELGYGSAIPLYLEDTVDYSELFTGSSEFQNEIKQNRNIENTGEAEHIRVSRARIRLLPEDEQKVANHYIEMNNLKKTAEAFNISEEDTAAILHKAEVYSARKNRDDITIQNYINELSPIKLTVGEGKKLPLVCGTWIKEDDELVIDIVKYSDRNLTVEEICTMTGLPEYMVKHTLSMIASQKGMYEGRKRLINYLADTEDD